MSWETYEAMIGGKPARISIDGTAAAELEQADLPNLLFVELSPHDLHGTPDAQRVEELHRELQEWFTALGGRLVSCVRQHERTVWHIYLACGWLEAANLVHRIGLRCGLVLGAEMRADPCQRIYYALLPTTEERRNALNARQLEALLEHNATPHSPMPVHHTLGFANHTQALALARFARNHGFRVEGLLPPSSAHGQHLLHLSRPTPLTLQAINADTHLLEAQARQLGGTYQGWQVGKTLACTA